MSIAPLIIVVGAILWVSALWQSVRFYPPSHSYAEEARRNKRGAILGLAGLALLFFGFHIQV